MYKSLFVIKIYSINIIGIHLVKVFDQLDNWEQSIFFNYFFSTIWVIFLKIF